MIARELQRFAANRQRLPGIQPGNGRNPGGYPVNIPGIAADLGGITAKPP
jgi:hypothetical protein